MMPRARNRRHVPQALGEGAPAAQQAGEGAALCGEGGGVEHGGDLDARLRVLVGDEVEQRSGAHEDDSPADRAALVLQRDLRAAQRVDAGQRPARKRDDPVARAGRQDDVAIGDLLRSPAGETVERAVPQIPDERIRPVVDAAFDAVERVVHAARLRRLETVERGIGAGEAGRGAAIDLAAALRRLVEDDRGEPCGRQRFRRAAAGGAGTDDDRWSIVHRPRRFA